MIDFKNATFFKSLKAQTEIVCAFTLPVYAAFKDVVFFIYSYLFYV